jgi:predicted aspartyl protease
MMSSSSSDPESRTGGAGAQLIVQTHLHRRWWVIVPLIVGGTLHLEMVLDTGSSLSAVSAATAERLRELGLIPADAGQRFTLRDVTISGHAVADIAARLSARVGEVGAEGLLGLDFLGRFSDIHFHTASMRLTLTY